MLANYIFACTTNAREVGRGSRGLHKRSAITADSPQTQYSCRSLANDIPLRSITFKEWVSLLTQIYVWARIGRLLIPFPIALDLSSSTMYSSQGGDFRKIAAIVYNVTCGEDENISDWTGTDTQALQTCLELSLQLAFNLTEIDVSSDGVIILSKPHCAKSQLKKKMQSEKGKMLRANAAARDIHLDDWLVFLLFVRESVHSSRSRMTSLEGSREEAVEPSPSEELNGTG
ncbi:hypothetical protein VTO42DRAFT_1733 [Malbranchea cinnamomea]